LRLDSFIIPNLSVLKKLGWRKAFFGELEYFSTAAIDVVLMAMVKGFINYPWDEMDLELVSWFCDK
jgi:hypothetical protein